MPLSSFLLLLGVDEPEIGSESAILTDSEVALRLTTKRRLKHDVETLTKRQLIHAVQIAAETVKA